MHSLDREKEAWIREIQKGGEEKTASELNQITLISLLELGSLLFAYITSFVFGWSNWYG